MRKPAAFLIVLFLTLGVALASGAGSSSEREAILGYHLTLPRAHQLITAMEAMSRYVASLPDYPTRVAKAMKMTPAERRAQVENDPRAMAILKRNGLTSTEYLVGVPALRMALMSAQGAKSQNIVASPANVAFARANLADLKPKMDAADGIGARK